MRPVVTEYAPEKRLERYFRATGSERLNDFIASIVVPWYISGAVQKTEQTTRRPNSTTSAPVIT